MSRMILIIGAGKSGRGFLPQYIRTEDHILFIDKEETLIHKLKQTKSYQIAYYGQTKEAILISNYEAYTATYENFKFCISQCDMIAISIGVEQYSELAEMLKPFITCMKEKAIVTFENCLNAAERLQILLDSNQLEITEGSIFCTTNTRNDIDIISQELCYLPIKNNALDHIYLEHIMPIDDFLGFMERKLYTYNLLSALFCYPGYLKGYKWLYEAALDAEIQKDAATLMQELNPLLANYFHVSEEEQSIFAQAAVDKFSNPYIEDSIQRNCRNAKRKLGKDERLMKPLRILQREHKDTRILLNTITDALIYDEKLESNQGIQLLDSIEMNKESLEYIKANYAHMMQ